MHLAENALKFVCLFFSFFAPVFLSSVQLGHNKVHSGEHRTVGHTTTKPISSVVKQLKQWPSVRTGCVCVCVCVGGGYSHI